MVSIGVAYRRTIRVQHCSQVRRASCRTHHVPVCVVHRGGHAVEVGIAGEVAVRIVAVAVGVQHVALRILGLRTEVIPVRVIAAHTGSVVPGIDIGVAVAGHRHMIECVVSGSPPLIGDAVADGRTGSVQDRDHIGWYNSHGTDDVPVRIVSRGGRTVEVAVPVKPSERIEVIGVGIPHAAVGRGVSGDGTVRIDAVCIRGAEGIDVGIASGHTVRDHRSQCA